MERDTELGHMRASDAIHRWVAPIILAAAAVLSLVAALVAAAVPLLAVMALAAASLAVLLMLSRSLVLAILLMSGLVDLLTPFRIGPLSAMGVTTILYAIGSWFVWLLRAELPARLRRALLPFAMFLFWAGVSMVLWYRPSVEGVQNLLVIVAFLGLIVLTANETRRSPEFIDTLGRVMTAATVIAVVLQVLSYHLGVMPGGFGIQARSFALFALVALAWQLGRWRSGDRRAFWAALAIVGLIGISLSRTAFVVGVLLFPASHMRLQSVRGWFQAGVLGVGAVGLLYTIVSRVEPLRARFFEGDLSLKVGGIAINAMGRTAFWEITLASWRKSPLIGNGSGSAQPLIEAYFPGLGHPHNDYLRILHDYGLIGLAIWLVGYLVLLWVTSSAWSRSDPQRDAAAGVHLAAFLALAAVAAAMVTDNTMVYVFVMAPAGILVGASFGVMERDQHKDPAPTGSTLGPPGLEDGPASGVAPGAAPPSLVTRESCAS